MRRLGIIGLAVAVITAMGALPAGAGWEPPTVVRRGPNAIGSPEVVAVGDTIHVAWVEYILETSPDEPGSSERGVTQSPVIRYRRSTDGGVTWGPQVRLGSATDRVAGVSLAVNGPTVHVVWWFGRADVYPNTGPMYHRRSTDGGVNWRPTRRIASAVFERPDIEAAGTKVHVLYSTPKGVFYLRSTSGGAFWGAAPVRVSKAGETTVGWYYPTKLALAGSNVIVAYHNGDWGTPSPARFRVSTDQGTSWGPLRPLTDPVLPTEPILLAADGDHVHAVSGTTHRASHDGGTTWGPRRSAWAPMSMSVRGPIVEGLGLESPNPGTIRLVYRRSIDDGVTWGTATIRATSKELGGSNAIGASAHGPVAVWIEYPKKTRSVLYFSAKE